MVAGTEAPEILRKLQAIRAELIADFSKDAGSLVDGGDCPEGDQPEHRASQDVRVSSIKHLSRELLDVDAAIERVQKGYYGVCMDCGKSIPAPRLRANPVATRCLTCQEGRERKQATVRRRYG